MKLVSVVIPVYNVEKYVEKCLDSVINQTYQNLEIIIVNDGSTDNSLSVCQKKKLSDSRIKLINKENGGLSSARNAGIECAQGEFICFIDSDDWIELDYIEVLLNGMENTNVDISVIQMIKVKDFNKIAFQSESQTKWDIFERETAMRELFSSNLIGYSANNKLYRISLFKSIRYPEGMLMEDKGTTYRLIDSSTKVAVNGSTKYHYYLRDNSILRTDFNQKNFDSFIIHEEILNFMDEHYPSISPKVKSRYVYEAIRMMMRMIESNYT
ncbi:glycosyltransferase family 2 protein, partial [Enterococcus faecalis]|nr:glycosyltransferase family 2 protein [Enterococcus faecalis]EIT2194265.1 glycosyltransferase family 2 protein [Enterococcus faecalis]EJG4476565.1 glycosyltransferase family 2 protein [Enterococcus faecalis]EKZ0199458.1 glycosyltransferase family 2 protein [Enterococcus faecalis]HCT1439963.1 glycosyltransferase family 2 protein [Enterococcus faecalis]